MEKAPGEMMEKARVIAKQHHEKWNGKGYLGMKGREIDIAARIVALARKKLREDFLFLHQ